MLTALARLRRFVTHRTFGPLLFALFLGGLLLARGRTVSLDCASTGVAFADDMPATTMTDWFVRHPVTPSNVSATAAVVDSFNVLGTSFQHASDPTVIDTAKIVVGDAIKWKWVTGSHTITSGTDSGDPNSGAVFNASSNTSVRTFTFQFDNEGTVPFYCVFHEGFNMKGVVVVGPNSASVGPPAAVGGEGFVRSPWPNPSPDRISFQYALSRAAHVRATVIDAQGRRVATAYEGDRPAGTYESRWTGRDAGGQLAAAGVYFVRLEIAGRVQARRITLLH